MKLFINTLLAICIASQSFFGVIPHVATASSEGTQAASMDESNAVEPVPLLTDTHAEEAAVYKEEPSLSVKANPQLIIPDTPISIEWTIKGWEDISNKAGLSAILQFPADLKTSDTSALITTEGDESSMQLPISDAEGKSSFSLGEKPPASFLIDISIQASDSSLVANSILLTQPSLEAIAGKDNHLVSKDEKVTLDFPAKSLTESLCLDVRDPSPSSITGYSLSGRPVEIVAVGMSSKKNISKFIEPFTLTMKYDPEHLYGGSVEDLAIYYYEETIDDWLPIPTTVDQENQTLTAQVDHLTVFDYQANSWQGYRLPTIDRAQVSGNSGAATYQMSFWLPPATGSFAPALTLNYNSQIIDSSSAFTQASWVGAGWSLDTGYIERNMHGTNTDLSDDTFQLILGGVSNTLLPISTSGTVTNYATAEMNYQFIKFDSSTKAWTIKDQAGTTYKLEFPTITNASNACVPNSADLNLTWRWSLTSVKDKFLNTFTYNYENQMKSGSTTCLNEIAVYPTSIIYPNNHYKINFPRESRSDYQTSWEGNDSKVFFQNERLDTVKIKYFTNNTWVTIRQYDFTYSAGTTNQVYPDFTWAKGGRTSTLVGVKEVSGDGSANLPATQFTYSDKMHLTKVDNSQGGSVSFTYERWTYLDDVNDDLWSLYTVFGEDECTSSIGTAWYALTGYGTTKM